MSRPGARWLASAVFVLLVPGALWLAYAGSGRGLYPHGLIPMVFAGIFVLVIALAFAILGWSRRPG